MKEEKILKHSFKNKEAQLKKKFPLKKKKSMEMPKALVMLGNCLNKMVSEEEWEEDLFLHHLLASMDCHLLLLLL